MKLEYQHLVQKPSLCSAASLQMVLLRRGTWVDQEEIALGLGVKIPAEETSAFLQPLPIGRNAQEYGVSLADFASNRVKTFLRRHQPSLNVKVHRVSQIPDVTDFLRGNLTAKNDVMANFRMEQFKPELVMGHFSLISEIEGDAVTICDPWPTNRSFWTTSVNDLVQAMGSQFDGRERGFVVFS